MSAGQGGGRGAGVWMPVISDLRQSRLAAPVITAAFANSFSSILSSARPFSRILLACAYSVHRQRSDLRASRTSYSRPASRREVTLWGRHLQAKPRCDNRSPKRLVCQFISSRQLATPSRRRFCASPGCRDQTHAVRLLMNGTLANSKRSVRAPAMSLSEQWSSAAAINL